MNTEIEKLARDSIDYGYNGTSELDTKMHQALATAKVVEKATLKRVGKHNAPKVVCLCGSTRFSDAFQNAQLNETLKGNIVLTIGCNMKADKEIFGHLPESELTQIKIKLDELHKRKIDMCDEVLILNVGGYIGESTSSEIAYAENHGKKIRYLESLKQGKLE